MKTDYSANDVDDLWLFQPSVWVLVLLDKKIVYVFSYKFGFIRSRFIEDLLLDVWLSSESSLIKGLPTRVIKSIPYVYK